MQADTCLFTFGCSWIHRRSVVKMWTQTGCQKRYILFIFDSAGDLLMDPLLKEAEWHCVKGPLKRTLKQTPHLKPGKLQYTHCKTCGLEFRCAFYYGKVNSPLLLLHYKVEKARQKFSAGKKKYAGIFISCFLNVCYVNVNMCYPILAAKV